MALGPCGNGMAAAVHRLHGGRGKYNNTAGKEDKIESYTNMVSHLLLQA